MLDIKTEKERGEHLSQMPYPGSIIVSSYIIILHSISKNGFMILKGLAKGTFYDFHN